MGLLDFLKKKSKTPANTVQPGPEPGAQSAPEAMERAAEAAAGPEDGPAAKSAAAQPLAVQPQTVALPAAGSASGQIVRAPELPPTVTAYDEFGREVRVRLEDWRTMMLAELERRRDDPDALYAVILQALEFRLADDVLPAAERLYELESGNERSTTVLGIVQMDTGDAAGAGRLFAEFLHTQQERGEQPSGVVMTNYAKALVATGDPQAGDAMLWRAIEADPNQENGLGWWAALAKERGGEGAYVDALQRASAIPGAWRPQTWLAHEALRTKDLPRATALYIEALARAGNPAPVVLLQSMSGDLGTAGYLNEALALTRPAYVAAVHGLPVGNNLIKASLDLAQFEQAEALVQELQQQARPDWSATLQFWDTEIHRARLAAQAPMTEAAPQISALAFEGPAWLPAQSPARTLFSAAGNAKLLFLAASVTYADQPEALRGMLPDAQGRLSRALPLFLAESAFLHMGLDAMAIIPWIVGHGFAVMGVEWTDADAAEYARNAGAAGAIALHIQQTGERSEVRLRVVPAAASALPVRSVSVPVDWQQTGVAALQLWSQMAHAVLPLAGGGAAPALDAARYRIPAGPQLADYLLRLEQLLAVRCAGSELSGRQFLSGEREIVRGQLDLALSMPDSLPLRLILHETLLRMRDLRPEIVTEVRGPVELLQQRYPMADAEANAVLQQQLRTIWPAA